MSHIHPVQSRAPILIFFCILLLAAYFRLYNTFWDGGTHLHPDERMIIMVAERIRLPQTSVEYDALFTPESTLNPKFFAYGSFPIYVLKITGWLLGKADYDGLLVVGRTLSALIDTASVILVFFLTRLLTQSRSKDRESGKKLTTISPYLAMFFYAVSVLPIQSSHFFISDLPLTFLSLATLLGLIVLQHTKRPTLTALFIGCCFGLALATKITAILLAAPIAVAFLFWFLKKKHVPLLLFYLILVSAGAAVMFAATMPYGVIDFTTFKTQTLDQSRMSTDPYIFPYTLQYVGTTPYWYFIKNMLLWGMGIPLGVLAFSGTLWVLVQLIKNTFFWLKHRQKPITNHLYALADQQVITIIVLFFLLYFGFIGKSAVKFMRYMHPVYPLLCVFAAVFVSSILARFSARIVRTSLLAIGILVLLWPLSFLMIYTRPHSRIAASDWIGTTIPVGSRLAIEHWDDALPIGTGHLYQFLEMPMYEDDANPKKWEQVERNLQDAQYMILSSNRLYVPLQKLSDCSRYKRCYPKTAEYYRRLFAGELGFEKIAEFSSYPTVPILGIPVIDDDADESFTVYDHPKVIIFRRL